MTVYRTFFSALLTVIISTRCTLVFALYSSTAFSKHSAACPLNQPLYPILRVGQKLPELHGNPISLLPCIGVVCNQSFLLFLQSHIALQHIAGPVKEVIILTLIQLLGE